jgi:hypothetical protein
VSNVPGRTSEGIHSSRVHRRPPRFSATVLALGIIFVVAWVFLLRTPPPVPSPDVAGIQGTYVLVRSGATPPPGATPRPASTRSGSFAALESGDAQGTTQAGSPAPAGGRPGVRSSYDARLRTETTTQVLVSGTRATQTVGAWPPVWRTATLSPLDYQGLAAVVRSAVEDNDRTVGIKPLKDGDRTVWRAEMQLDGSTIQLVVDQQTGIVVWYSSISGARTDTFTAAPLWGTTPSPGALTPGDTPGTETLHDPTYTYVPSLETAGRAAGYVPLASDLAPDGYAVRAVATAAAGGAPGAWLIGPRGPLDVLAGQLQVAQLYTRGLSWFTVEQLGPAAAVKSAASVRDTLQSIAGDKLSFQTTTLQYGAFAGRTASTWFEASGPTLFVSDQRHVIFITGALTRQELVAFAEGLKPLGAGASPFASPAP